MSSIDAVRRLEDAGFNRQQAEALVRHSEEAVDMRAATKHDVQVAVDNAKWQVIVFLVPVIIAVTGLLATYLTVLINSHR